MKNVLVFPCGSEIGLDIYRLVHYSTFFHLVGGSSVDDHGSFLYEDYIPGIPFVSSPDFIPVLARIVKDRKIDAIYPTMDSVITVLKENEQLLGCIVISSTVETTKICLSKRLTYKRLNGIVRTPVVYNTKEIPSEMFPVFAKPDVGYGAKGTKRIDNQIQLESFLDGKDDILLIEYIPGEEYTVDCFTDKEGKLLYSAARRRNRIKDGISVNTSFVEDQGPFSEMAERINAEISFRGAWFYQVKESRTGELCLLEIASRLGGSSLLSFAIGVNFALLSLFDAFGIPVQLLRNDYQVVLDRALDNKYKTDLHFDSVYCDYDDCLIINKKQVNTLLVSFLFKCLNEKKKIYLLSKHEGNLMEELRAFRLDSLFDEVIQIDQSSNKVDYIKHANAIFIDDSYAERANIRQTLGLQVFSPEMVEVFN